MPRLPNHLMERIRIIQQGNFNLGGQFVLYWMHHAMRTHENPALDTALEVANRYHLPVLVYQGLGGKHPHNSDRHHTFIMEAARDVQAAFEKRDIAYRFYMPEDPAIRSPLRSLAANALLVVTEDFPAPPFPTWTQKLAQAIEQPVWAVDCCCLIPMQWHQQTYVRAYEFRVRTKVEYAKRVHTMWRPVQPEAPPFEERLNQDFLDLGRTDIPTCCAACNIDHTVGPVPHTPGGSKAGYRRWEHFKGRGLSEYGRLRNDPTVDPPQGVSRLSPYLHYGCVSPFRIAREAAEHNAEKFLDELLIWRELAHNLCFFNEQCETLELIPEWARCTLKAHEPDERDALYSWERLARGKTDDQLWDAAQKSLLIHGELHNNVRMTWGKALLKWTASVEQAFQLMVHLNHRYALDGNDPNSYGGILWCLGLFDRPFSPQKPIYGSVRTRDTKEQVKRINLEVYWRKTMRSTRDDDCQVAVVGAGISGLFAARALGDHGINVHVYEKSRGTGGRLATRRAGNLAFDIGAQYFTVRHPCFKCYVDSWLHDGLVRPWQGRIISHNRSGEQKTVSAPHRYVGVPRMTTISRHLAQDLKLSFKTRIAHVEHHGGSWQLISQAGNTLGPYDAVILATPPAQTVPLLAAAPQLAHKAALVTCSPCWAVTAAFDRPLPLQFDGAFVNSPTIRWAARDNSKPGRPKGESWVIHAAGDWSEEHLEEVPIHVAEVLLGEFFSVMDINPEVPALLDAHRWRYAKPATLSTKGCLWDAKLKIGACGDWCVDPRIEGAALSGMAITGRVLGLPARVSQTAKKYE